MILVFATINLKEGKNQEFLDITDSLIENTRKESGNISYDLYKDTQVDNVFVFVEKWKDEDVLSEHMETPHFKAFGEGVGSLLAEDLDIVQYKVSD
jgi:quinol monooxygenase YgiN